ncbi:hypothetical protein [Streptomyces naphthomycinicus]|uniref:hypothetical protein n=1 Tax=Streptomyces naphthomycinicus TaxID=2872625 RepID=UPI001CEC718F|nr:hypothetical protein [Streptomyces sp. TML10]
MTFQRVKRMAAAAGVVVAAGAVPIVAATPASASQSACTNYVASHGYYAGPKVKEACSYGAFDTPTGPFPSPGCELGLRKLDIKSEVSSPACRRA